MDEEECFGKQQWFSPANRSCVLCSWVSFRLGLSVFAFPQSWWWRLREGGGLAHAANPTASCCWGSLPSSRTCCKHLGLHVLEMGGQCWKNLQALIKLAEHWITCPVIHLCSRMTVKLATGLCLHWRCDFSQRYPSQLPCFTVNY